MVECSQAASINTIVSIVFIIRLLFQIIDWDVEEFNKFE